MLAREVEPSGVVEGVVVGWVTGPGSDFSEEPAVQDGEPVTLDAESFLSVLPGPLVVQCACRASVSMAR